MQKQLAFTFSIALSVLLLCASVVTIGKGRNTQNKTEQEVLKVVDDALNALVKRDIALIERTFTADYYTVYDFGLVGDRARVIESLKSTTSGWDAWERGETRVKIHGNTAFVLSQTKAKMHSPRGNSEQQWQTTTILVKEGGQWKLAASQFTIIKPPAPPAQPKQQ
jgi:ketosteroid isomerase-like protein